MTSDGSVRCPLVNVSVTHEGLPPSTYQTPPCFVSCIRVMAYKCAGCGRFFELLKRKTGFLEVGGFEE